MPIKFTLVENKLPGNEGKYRAVVRRARTVGQKEVFERALQQGSTMTLADLAGSFEDVTKAIVYLLLEGYNVCTDLANFRVTIRGPFDGRLDTFDPERHEITVQVSAGRRIRRDVRTNARVEQHRESPAAPALEFYRDVHSKKDDDLVTPGGLGHIRGALLSFDPSDPRQGIFFVAVADNQATRVEQVAQNHPAALIFLVPPLPPGAYWLEVRARPYERSPDIRAGRLQARLRVEAE
jgi:hypothetical protein